MDFGVCRGRLARLNNESHDMNENTLRPPVRAESSRPRVLYGYWLQWFAARAPAVVLVGAHIPLWEIITCSLFYVDDSADSSVTTQCESPRSNLVASPNIFQDKVKAENAQSGTPGYARDWVSSKFDTCFENLSLPAEFGLMLHGQVEHS